MENVIVLEPPTPPPAPAEGLSVRDIPSADDWLWMNAERSKPDRGVFKLYEGLWVAVYSRQVVGAIGEDRGAEPLCKRVADRYGIDEARVVMVYIDGPDDFAHR